MSSTSCECTCLQPDPDIAGIGGMISFALGSGFTIVLAVSTLLLNLADSRNTIDRWVCSRVLKCLKRIDRNFAQKITHHILLPILFSSSDSQLLTGFTVLLAGWIQVWKNLSVYHFSVIMNMAWSATNSQLLAFFALQMIQANYSMRTMDLNRNPNHPSNPTLRRYPKFPRRSKTSRAVLMVGHFAMLFAAVTIQSHRDWNGSFKCPVKCVAKELRPGGGPLGMAILCYGLLLWGYGAAILPFALASPTFRLTESSRGRESLISSERKVPPFVRHFQNSFIGKCLTKVLFIVKAVLDSMTFQILLPGIWFVLGVLDMVGVRISGKIAFMSCGEDKQIEDRWGFGQLVPLLYLIAPVLPAIDAFKHYRTLKLVEEDVIERQLAPAPGLPHASHASDDMRLEVYQPEKVEEYQ